MQPMESSDYYSWGDQHTSEDLTAIAANGAEICFLRQHTSEDKNCDYFHLQPMEMQIYTG